MLYHLPQGSDPEIQREHLGCHKTKRGSFDSFAHLGLSAYLNLGIGDLSLGLIYTYQTSRPCSELALPIHKHMSLILSCFWLHFLCCLEVALQSICPTSWPRWAVHVCSIRDPGLHVGSDMFAGVFVKLIHSQHFPTTFSTSLLLGDLLFG